MGLRGPDLAEVFLWHRAAECFDTAGDVVGIEQEFEELPYCLSVCLLHRLGHCELAGPFNVDKDIELALSGSQFGDVAVKEPDRVPFEPKPL